jgi:adenylosuccinate synthase
MLATIVIGANYGDEGKGLMTDYFCSKKSTDLVVRFNGGAQAGHTVVTPEGKRHVFSHFGSGTFLGIPTYLYKYFVVNPIKFREEYETLKDEKPVVYIDSRCYITTPYDMLYNQYLEEIRGNTKHGSCGMGIGATMARYEDYFAPKITIYDYSCIEEIREYYLEKIGRGISEKYLELFHNQNLLTRYKEDIGFLLCHAIFSVKPPKFNHAIFEGAQGLALDQNMGRFPYVTRSNTGMRNVIKCQREWKFDIDEIVYVTRSYLTRHGADPNFIESDVTYEDNTNVENSWQDKIRFGDMTKGGAWLYMRDRIDLDLKSNGLTRLTTSITMAVTHVDQCENVPKGSVYASTGPTRNDVMKE